MRCKGTTASFIICKSWTSLHLPFDFFIHKIGVLHGLLQGTNSPCSFKVLMMCFNPQPQVSMDTASYVEISGSLSLTTIGIAFCAWPTDFPSAHTLAFTVCSTKGRERGGLHIYENRGMDLVLYIPPQKGWGRLWHNLALCKNSTESHLQLRGWLKY